MKNHLITLLLISGILFCCKKDDPEKIGPCGVKDPVNELPWLKESIKVLSNSTLSYAYFTILYKGERIFWYWSANKSSYSEYFTCEGTATYLPQSAYEPNADEETKQLVELIRVPSKSCSYVIWSNTRFKQETCK